MREPRVSPRKGWILNREADQVFHATVLEASGNEMLAALADVVGEVLAGRTHHHLMPARPNPEAIRLHSEVAQAIGAGDAPAATAAMAAIIDEASSAIRDVSDGRTRPDRRRRPPG